MWVGLVFNFVSPPLRRIGRRASYYPLCPDSLSLQLSRLGDQASSENLEIRIQVLLCEWVGTAKLLRNTYIYSFTINIERLLSLWSKKYIVCTYKQKVVLHLLGARFCSKTVAPIFQSEGEKNFFSAAGLSLFGSLPSSSLGEDVGRGLPPPCIRRRRKQQQLYRKGSSGLGLLVVLLKATDDHYQKRRGGAHFFFFERALFRSRQKGTHNSSPFRVFFPYLET